MPLGPYRIIVVADSSLQVPDANRANNTADTPLPLHTIVNWVGGSGDWNAPGNWLDALTLTHHVPGQFDDAVIDRPGITVTYSSGSGTA